MLIYVDATIVTGPNLTHIQRLISYLIQDFALKDMGDLHYFLEVEVLRTAGVLHLSQSKYIFDLLKRASMTDCKLLPTLADGSQYWSVVGASQYCTLTRLDIAFSVNKACQYMHSPTEYHLLVVNRILRYLAGTITHGLLYNSSPDLSVTCFTDAEWASCPNDHHSTSAFCIFLGMNIVSWSSYKQKIVSRSSIESNYRILANGTAELLSL
ncbi:uncharacterized mitochondrial protein AtMg00810-like [Humulus lupulus]|uniref:uncharacterized mitochondrial protein AtMg00810-like n=1 Tax=Humulus lupulus TaxID=3486 RepID=UPI002B408EA6|nr:uncharacterized mitochondrial protein AtMg00810-like [Humulus lupulus]